MDAEDLDWTQVLGWIGAIFTIAIHSMRTMIALRWVAIAGNCVFILLGAALELWPIMVLHGALLCLNGFRLRQMILLTRQVRAASRGDPSMEWVKPFSARRRVRQGQTVFHRGDPAESMFYVASGRLRLVESGIALGAGDVVGELGLVAPDGRRTQSLRAEEDSVLLVITYEQVRRLYYENPAFGFYLLRLMTRRLFDNNAELARRLAQQATPTPANEDSAAPAQPGAAAAPAAAGAERSVTR